MRAAYVRAPYQFAIRDVVLRGPGDNEALVDVRSCGVCGADLESARGGARTWQALGHEVAGVVTAVGTRVRDVAVGQKVLWPGPQAGERNADGTPSGPAGRPPGDPLGFSDAMVALATELVPFDGISFTAAALVGPLGVALALVTAADVALGDDVLVMGTGAIGLMAIRLAKARGAHRVFAAQRSGARRRLELAQELGADVLIHPDEVRLVDHPFPRGGVDRVLVTTPPALIGSAVRVCRNGGVIAYAGAGCGEQARITIDGNRFRERGLALRGTGNPDVSAYRRCVDLIRAGVLDAERLVSHTFLLEEIPQAFRIMSDDRQNRVKLVMVKD